MSDQHSPDDHLLRPSLAGLGDQQRSPYNVGFAIFPGLIGGPVAVSIVMFISALRLRASPVVLSGIVAVGIGGLGFSVWLAERYPDIGSSAFRYGAIGAFILQFVMVTGRFRAWQLRGLATDKLLAIGIAYAVLGAIVDVTLVESLGLR